MEINEEFRINICGKIGNWCYYPPLDVIIYESEGELTVLEAATGCVNRRFDLNRSDMRAVTQQQSIRIDVLGREKLAIARGRVFNCRGRLQDALLLESALQTRASDPGATVVLEMGEGEARALLDLLQTSGARWASRRRLGLTCSLWTGEEDGEGDDGRDRSGERADHMWKWNIVTFTCPINVLYEWILEIAVDLKENVSGLPIISSIIYRIKSLQVMDHDIRFSIFERSKEFMNIEANRFLSFEMWPHKSYKWATPELMSRVGFYHHPRRPSDDRALCFLCNICLITWEATDEPWSEHQRHSPNCPLFKNNFTSNVPLSISEASMTAQKQNSTKNINLIAKSAGNRYMATVSENGHICVWDTGYLLRKLVEFDTPDISRDGLISVDSACLIDNSLLTKTGSKTGSSEMVSGFHLVLGVRLFLSYDKLYKYLQTLKRNNRNEHIFNNLLDQDLIINQCSFIFVIEIPYEFNLVTAEERKQFPDYTLEANDFQTAVDFEFYEDSTSSVCPTNHFLHNKNWYLPSYDEYMSDQAKESFLDTICLGDLWNESKEINVTNPEIADDRTASEKSKFSSSNIREVSDTSLIEIIPIIFNNIYEDFFSEPVIISDIYPIILDNTEDSETVSSVFLLINAHKNQTNDPLAINGALYFYKCIIVGDAEYNLGMKLQKFSTTLLSYNDCVKSFSPINIELLESNCSESSSTTNADDAQIEPISNGKNMSNKSQFHWLLLTNNNEIFLYSTSFSEISNEEHSHPLSEIATKIPINKELPGSISKLQLFTDMDRLCLLTDDGIMAFYTIATKRQPGCSYKASPESKELENSNTATQDSKASPPLPDKHEHHSTQESLLVEQENIIDELNSVFDLLQYEIVTSRIKLTYGCNWVEVSQSEIIDLKTNGNNFITTGPITLRYLPTKSSSSTIKVSDQQQCFSRTLNFRASQVCSREQIIEFSTAKQLCLGHIDLRFDLYEKQNKDSNLIYVTLLRQHKFAGVNSAKEPNGKLKSSVESNIIINDLEAPFIDDDMAQYYDTSNFQEPNSDLLRKLDGEIVAGPYLLNKYYQTDTTSVFLSMTSAELIKCRSRYYAIHIRVRSPVPLSSEKCAQSGSAQSSPMDMNNYGKCDSSSLNIKAITLSLRKFSTSPSSVHNDRSQRLAILRNPKFLKRLLKLLSGECLSKMPKELVINYGLDILNWIIVMYLNDIKPHSEKIYKIISTITECLDQIIYNHLILGDREVSKKMSKILTTLISLEKRYWSFDSRYVDVPQNDCYKLCKSIYTIFKTKIHWLLNAKCSVAIQNFFIIMSVLEQLFARQSQMISKDTDFTASSVLERLGFLSEISIKYSAMIDKDCSILLKSILGYPHNPLTGELFDVHITDLETTKSSNNLHKNLAKVISRKPQQTSDFGINDLQAKSLLSSFSLPDQVYKQILENSNPSPEVGEDIISTNFSLQDIQKAFREMIMENVKASIQLMRIPQPNSKMALPMKSLDMDLMSANLSSINCSPWFKSLLWSKMNSKSTLYSDMKKKSKITSVNYLNPSIENVNETKPIMLQTEQLYPQHRIDMLRNSSILEVDFIPVYFDSASEGTILDTVENIQFDQYSLDRESKIDTLNQSPVTSLSFLMEEIKSQPTTPKTTPVITTQTTPMHDSPINSPLPSTSPNKSSIIEDSNPLLTDNSDDHRLNYSLQTNSFLNVSRMNHIIVNRLHANARRHITLNLRQWSIITDIIIPSCDKLQKIIIRVGSTNKEDEMQTIVVHSNIITEPLIMLNIQPEIICHFVQVVIIAKTNITAERSRINIGTLYGRPAVMPWEIPSCKDYKISIDSVNSMLDYLSPRAETISMHYAITSETLHHLLQRLVKCGINQQILSDTLPDPYHHAKLGSQSAKQMELLKLLNQINSVYHKCCQLQQQISIVNNHINRYRAFLKNESSGFMQNYTSTGDDNSSVCDNCDVDKLKIIIEIALESLLLDKSSMVETDTMTGVMELLSNIMTNLMIYGTREMQTIIISWIPKMLTAGNDSSEMLHVWIHKWLKDFLLRCFTNQNITISPFIKEELFSSICVVFQRLANAGYHQQLFENLLDIFVVILQPKESPSENEIIPIDIELFNWMLLFLDFLMLWIIEKEPKCQLDSFSEWKFLFWNPYINSDMSEKCSLKPTSNNKEKLSFLKQQLLQLAKYKEHFIDYVNETGYDSWFCQLIVAEYSSMYGKLVNKITGTIAKLKKTAPFAKDEKSVKPTSLPETKNKSGSFLKSLSSSISTTVKLLMNALNYMDFQVSQDVFILTCMVLNKLFMLAQANGFQLSGSFNKKSLFSIVERAFSEPIHCRNSVTPGVFSLHACRILLLELVRNDIKILVSNRYDDKIEACQLNNDILESLINNEDQIYDCGLENDNNGLNEDEEDLDNEEEDITPTGADDEDINSMIEPYAVYVTHLGNISKQKELLKYEESPSDDYTDLVEEFDLLGHPSSFLSSYAKSKISKEYPTSIKAMEMEKNSNNQMDIVKNEIHELSSLHSILYYDLRLENSIFTDQELSYNQNQLKWKRQVQNDIYEQLPVCHSALKLPNNSVVNKITQPLAIGHIFESINELLDKSLSEQVNIQEIATFVCHLCHLLDKENLLVEFDSLKLSSTSLLSLLEKLLQLCSSSGSMLLNYCKLVCALLTLQSTTTGEIKFFKTIFHLSDELDNREIIEEVLNLFQVLVTKCLENAQDDSRFVNIFLDVVYDIIDNWNLSKERTKSKSREQLASIFIVCVKPRLIEWLQANPSLLFKYVFKVTEVTSRFLRISSTEEQRKCFSSLVPEMFIGQLLHIEQTTLPSSVEELMIHKQVFVQLNLVILEIITINQELFLPVISTELLKTLLISLSLCTSNMFESSKCFDVSILSTQLVKHLQITTVGDVIWQQLVSISNILLASMNKKTKIVLSSLLSTVQSSIPSINEPLFLLSIWIIPQLSLQLNEEISYTELLSELISSIVTFSNSRLSISPVNSLATRLSVSLMHQTAANKNSSLNVKTEEISNNSRPNVSPFCRISCQGNDSSDPYLLAKLLSNQLARPFNTLRTNRTKTSENVWSYEFYPHETQVQITITLPCDMIVHKIILHPRSIREFSPQFEVIIKRDSANHSTTNYQQIHKSLSINDGIVIDHISSRKLSNKIILRFYKPLLSKLVLQKIEICTINQWWDHKFQIAGDTANMYTYRCLHLFNHVIKNQSVLKEESIYTILSENEKFLSILLNWNLMYSIANSSTNKLLIKNSSFLITDLLVFLGQNHQTFSITILNKILDNVSLSSSANQHIFNSSGLQFFNETSTMKLSIFYNLITIEDQYSFLRMSTVVKWFETLDYRNMVSLDSVASVVYLLSVAIWYHSHNSLQNNEDWSTLFNQEFIYKLHSIILNSNGLFRKSLYRLVTSVCSLHETLYQAFISRCPIISPNTQHFCTDNLKLILWASQSESGSRLLLSSGILPQLVDRITLYLSPSSILFKSKQIYTEISGILNFFTKLCSSGCNFIKIWLGKSSANSFWQPIIDYLIDYDHESRLGTVTFNKFSSIMKVELTTAVVKFFSAVTLCCEDNQETFIKILINVMNKYRSRSDTLVLSDCIRRLILEVVVKEPQYCVVIKTSSNNHSITPFPGWIICEDELGNSRLSFRHPFIASQSNCIFIDSVQMTSQFSQVISQLTEQLNHINRKSPSPSPRTTNSSSEGIDYFLKKISESQTLNINPKLQSTTAIPSSFPRIPFKFNHSTNWSISLTYKENSIDCADNIFDFVNLNEFASEFNGGFVNLSCTISKSHASCNSLENSKLDTKESRNYLLVKFTELGGLKLLGKMLPLLYTDIRRVSSASIVCRTPVNPISSHTGFIDDDLNTPTDTTKSNKSLPQIPAHSITAFCLFLNIDEYSEYVIHEKEHRSALLHLLLGVTYDYDGVSLLQKYSKIQCVPFFLLTQLLQNQLLSSESHQNIINTCVDLGLIDYFINLLSILGHVDSSQSIKCFKSSGPYIKFISQTLCDLHYQLFYPLTNLDKPDLKSSSNTPKSAHIVTTSMDPKSHYITFMPFIDEKKNYWAKGTGFGTGGMYSTWDSEFVLLRQNLEEINASAILDTLSAFIYPSDDDNKDSNMEFMIDFGKDVLPTKAVECIYQSSLLTFICSYLRNDSVLDVSQHVNIYKSILRLIRAMAKHKRFCHLLIPHITQSKPYLDPQLNHTISYLASTNSVSQLLSQLKICVDTYINRLKKVPGATNKPSESARKLHRQLSIRRKCSNYIPFHQTLKSQRHNETESKEEQSGAESENLAQLLPDINQTFKLLNDVEVLMEKIIKQHEMLNNSLASFPANGYIIDVNGDVSHETSDQIKISKESHYIELMRKLQFGMYEIIHPNPDQNGKIKFTIPYYFKKNVESIFSTNSASASLSRARRLAQETVTLSTSLPLSYSSSVFVRCDENHLDIMKVIIVGPPDTPYANGCFEFDVYFPMEYPKAPPLLNLQTTGNGSVRFNPNLYNEGKVCLSILNTWHGRPEERWSSRTSSFLQVLVSIQSLILVPEPYFNEPGYERSRGTPSGNNASLAYSANIQAATARWAILEMIKNPPVCFAEVIRQHFLLKKDEIINQIQSWIDFYLDSSFDTSLFNSTRPSISNSVQSLKKNIVLIKKELENLEKGNSQL